MTIVLAYILDLLIGDPFSFHPVIWIGNLIKKLDQLKHTKLNGFFLLMIVSGISTLVVLALHLISYKIHLVVGIVMEVWMIYTIFATKSLDVETRKVYKALKEGDIKSARKWIGYLVSRDTSEMTESDIVKACVETISENITDGIIAPLFYITIGGAPLGWYYKSVNTLDSMVGYKNEKYKDFGYFSAKWDDVLNYIPARMTGVLILIVGSILKYDTKNGIKVLKRDKRNHASPNSAYSEAAVAGLLNIQLGGKASYFGIVSMKPTMGDENKAIEVEDIQKTKRIMYLTSAVGLLILLLLRGAIYAWW